MTARARAGCQACRVRHLKCDQATPVCGRCNDFDRDCVRGYPYRKYKHDKFGKKQKWLRTPSELTWEDESTKLAINYGYENESESETPHPPSENESNLTSPATVRRVSEVHSPQSPLRTRSGLRSSTGTPRTAVSTLQDEATPTSTQGTERHQSLPHIPGVAQQDFALSYLPSPATSSSKGIPDNDLIHAYSDVTFTGHEQVFNEPLDLELPPLIYSERPIWPLTDPAEALLLRHFVQNLAIWLDLCDPSQHFQVVVPQRAGTCPILLNAIFALSARHLSIVGKYDTFAGNRYHEECLKHLIPMLGNATTVRDDTLFAATIILRVLEEIDLLEADLESHMLGITVFVSTSILTPLSPAPSGLWRAAFWVGLRQEIYVATLKHTPVSLHLSHRLIDRSVTPTSDSEWANRAVVHCADVLNWCFGPHREGSKARWWELKEASEQWDACKPASFTPIYQHDADTHPSSSPPSSSPQAQAQTQQIFPEIWHSHASHIIGVQHHILALILLSIFDPRIPKVGGAAKVAVRAMEAQVRPLLARMCGIGLANGWTPPGLFTACMGIAIAGDRVEERRVQEGVMEVLVRTEREHARPTRAIQKLMREAWGW